MRLTSSAGAISRPTAGIGMDVIVEFARAVNGHCSYDGVLAMLSELCGADAIQIDHVDPFERTSHRIEAYDREAHRFLTPRNRPSLACAILGEGIVGARPGSLWLMSEVMETQKQRALIDSRRLDDWEIRDVAAIPLCDVKGGTDVLELHFHSAFPEHCRAMILTLGQAIARLWADRGDTGRSRAPRPRNITQAAARPRQPRNILSSENPLHLTKSEYRVCVLVRAGHRAKEIADILSVEQCTVRTHLRAIFSKTEVSGHIALLHLLSVESQQVARNSDNQADDRRQITC
jgi:DNA-binding CsgD family transcriptional regulator